jgi:hypothetical protein
MSATDAALSHLVAARRELTEQRQVLDRMITDLDRLIDQYTDSDSAPPAAATTPTIPQQQAPATTSGSIDRAPSMRDAILRMLRSHGREVQTRDVVGELADQYGWAAASIRSSLVKLAKEGRISNPQRGYYVALRVPANSAAPANTEGPAEATAEPSVPDPAAEEGGGADGTDPVRVHDEDSSRQASHRGHDHGAPVMGA